jgi:hypothetical protein
LLQRLIGERSKAAHHLATPISSGDIVTYSRPVPTNLGVLVMHNWKKKEDFSTLSIADLLEARDAYHIHLANLKNVVGTAIGKYMIRKSDPDADDENKPLESPGDEIRTLTNSVIRSYSWPAVIVFVDDWNPPGTFDKKRLRNYIPPRLYLPDGRVVPTCTVYAAHELAAPPPIYDLQFSRGLVGGGYPILSTVQGEDRIGSVGCLVTDGHSVFALTNRHVAGPAGQEALTVADGGRHRVGESSPRALGKVDFAAAYPGWKSLRTHVNLDAGLVRVDDISGWTSQVFGIGEIGELIDANVDTLSLEVIDTPVRAYGSISGRLEGTIKALFYRYRTVGGFDYVADFLIGPRENDKTETVPTRPGDSGTIWFWDPPPADKEEDGAEAEKKDDEDKRDKSKLPRPVCLQWGGTVLQGRGAQDRSQFALATNLATVCRILDLELLPDWDIGHSEYWGKTGHYKLAAIACGLVRDTKLLKLMTENVERVGVSDADISTKNMPKASQEAFVALADVPDLVWRGKRGKEGAGHFADVDQEGTGKYAGQTLMDLWYDKPSTRTPAAWIEFYELIGMDSVRDQGSLPFRVRQIYEEMVDAVRNKSLIRFIGSAGVLAHYVGDACQPLHVSYLHHGRPGHPEEENVHAYYETGLLDRFRVELINGLNQELDGYEITSTFSGSATAANATMDLMRYTLEEIPPLEVIEAYNEYDGYQRGTHMWEVLHERTIRCMSQGALYLAEMWESAWLEGGGSSIANSKLKEQSKSRLKTQYMKKEWLESNWLRDMSFGG